jgi:DNA-binding MarR family transcriptional regulator
LHLFETEIIKKLRLPGERIKIALDQLKKEGFIRRKGKKLSIT